MIDVRVTTQEELDATLTDPGIVPGEHRIVICSPADEAMHVYDTRGLYVYVYDSATVYAYDRATVHAASRATVYVYDSATVYAYGRVTVYAASRATVHAYDSATVEAGTHVAVHRIDASASVTGGVLIDHTGSEQLTARQWCGYTGTATVGDEAVLYKALASSLVSGEEYGRATRWPTEGVVSCDDWDPSPVCGGGLHLSPTPWQAGRFTAHEGGGGVRYLECRVALDDLVPVPGGSAKAKARRVRVVREVAADGTPVGGGAL
nr:hypothetical protein [Actinomyces sp.]